MPILVGRCPRHGEFERIVARWEPTIQCSRCSAVVEPEPSAPALRFRGDGFQTPRPAPKEEAGSVKVKRNMY